MQRRTFLKLAPAVTLPAAGLPVARAMDKKKRPKLSWSGIRDAFPLQRNRAYLNTGGLGPPSRRVLSAISNQELAQAIEGEHQRALADDMRADVADFFGAQPREMAFTRNTTEGNSIIAGGLDLRRGDEVIFESHAHPGGSFPWLNRQLRDGIQVKVFDPAPESPEANLDRIFEKVTPRTRVIQVSHITAPTGLRFDLKAIAAEARSRGIWFHVDGAQSAGQVPLDFSKIGCDSYAICTHKWLNGPQGLGALYIHQDRIEEVACTHAGPYSSDNYRLPDFIEIHPDAVRHEYGTRNTASVVGLVEALRFQNQIGRERIAQHGSSMAERLRSQLEAMPGVMILTPRRKDMCAAMLTFQIEGRQSGDLARFLAENYSLRTRVVSEQDLNALRTSWHVYNSMAEVERVAEGVQQFIST